MLKKIGIFIYKCIRFFLLLTMFLLLWVGVPAAAIFGGIVLDLYFFFRQRKKARQRYDNLRGGFLKFADVRLSEQDMLRVVVLEELDRYARVGLVLAEKDARKKRLILTAVYLAAVFTLLMSCYYRISVFGWLTVLTVAYILIYFRIHPVEELCRDVRNEPERAFSEIVAKKLTETPPKPRYIQAIAAAVLVLGVFIAVHKTEKLTFAPTEGGVCLTDYRPGLGGFHQTVTVPDSHGGQPVVAIGDSAFRNNQLLETVHLPKTVTAIGSHAFQNCKKLANIQLPEGLTTLNGESFKNCYALEKITVPTGVTEIRGNTFEHCLKLRDVELHDGIVDIHAYAFYGCKALEFIVLPEHITEIHAYTFEGCSALTEIHIPFGVTRIAAHAFYGCSSLNYVFVPDSVTEIGSSAFRLCTALETIELPAGVAVDERAFKESPTKLLKKQLTDEQLRQIQAEIDALELDVMYYIYETANPEAVSLWDENTVLLVSDQRFAGQLPAEKGLGAVENETELVAYLKKAKAAGAQWVAYGIFSETGTKLTGEDYFAGRKIAIDKLIELNEKTTGEGA